MTISTRISPVFGRFCSTIASGSGRFSEDEINAILELKRKAERGEARKSIDAVIRSREWARAPVVEVSGRMPPASWQVPTKRGKRFGDEDHVEQPVVKIRWAGFQERDTDILLSGDETLYSAEVKAVLYGIIQAIGAGETKVRMRNSNEVVVKVANGRYKASKEVTRFHLIRSVINKTDIKSRENQLKAKLEKLDEKGIRRLPTTTLTENEFFVKFQKSIDDLKNYV